MPSENSNLVQVYVVGYDPLVRKMFDQRPGYVSTNSLSDAHLVCFTGGEDVEPFLYGEIPILGEGGTECVFTNPVRDMSEIRLFKSLPYEVAKVGICRGGQFVNVMSGGRLWQDVDNHCEEHFMRIESGANIKVTSTHHQMMRPGRDGFVHATAKKSTFRHAMDVANTEDPFDDIEVVSYWNTNSLCFQPHPEYTTATKEHRDYFFYILEQSLSLIPHRKETKK